MGGMTNEKTFCNNNLSGFIRAITDNEDDLLISNKVWQEILGKYFVPYLIQFCGALRHQFLYGVLGVKAKRCRSVCSQKFNLLG